MSTSPIEHDNLTGVRAAALVALASHIAEHQLPFVDISKSTADQHMSVFVYEADHTTWLNTIQIVTETNTPSTDRPERLHTVWLVRLPDTGLVVELRTWRTVPFSPAAALELVAGVSA